MIQRIALYATLGFLLDALGHSWDTWQFWSAVGLFWCADMIAGREGYQVGVAHGAILYKSMTEQQRADVDRLLSDINNKD